MDQLSESRLSRGIQSRRRENITPTPEEFIEIMQSGDKPSCAILCESGSWRSRQVADRLRESYDVDAVALERGISELANVNRYNKETFHILPETLREQTIRALAQIPIVIVVLDNQEYALYSAMLASLHTHIDRNHGLFIRAKDRDTAVKLFVKKFRPQHS